MEWDGGRGFRINRALRRSKASPLPYGARRLASVRIPRVLSALRTLPQAIFGLTFREEIERQARIRGKASHIHLDERPCDYPGPEGG